MAVGVPQVPNLCHTTGVAVWQTSYDTQPLLHAGVNGIELADITHQRYPGLLVVLTASHSNEAQISVGGCMLNIARAAICLLMMIAFVGRSHAMKIEEFAAAIEPKLERPSADQIADFEQLIGHKLPEDYRNFLQMTGGGGLTKLIGFRKGDLQENVIQMAGLGIKSKGQPSDLVQNFHKPGFHPLPKHLLQIGDDSAGNPLTICLREDRFGEIFIIDHELVSFDDSKQESIEDAEKNGGLAISLAPSFGAFVASLRQAP